MNTESLRLLIGRKIAAARRAKGISQTKLGLKAGLTQIHMSRIENGHTTTTETLANICNSLEINFEDLFQKSA